MITLQRRGIVDGYKGYSFARSSTAYGPDGKLYLPHNARFVPGPFPGSRALLVEEGTTPLIPSSYGLMTVDSDSNGVADGFSTAEHLASSVFAVDDQGQKITLAGATSSGSYSQVRIANLAVTENLPYTLSVDANLVRSGAETLDLQLQWFNADGGLVGEDVSPALTPSSSRLSFTATSPPGAAKCLLKFTIFAKAVGATGWARFKNAHFEQKPYATTFVVGTRAADDATLPSEAINPLEGTMKFWFRPGSGFFTDPGIDNYRTVIGHCTAVNRNEFNIARIIQTRRFGFATYNADGSGGVQSVVNPTEVADDTWYFMAIRWSASLAQRTFFINDVKAEGPYTTIPTIVNPITIGHHRTQPQRWCNMSIGPIQVSSEYESDDKILAAYHSDRPFQVDEHTTGLWPLDGPDSQRSAKCITV